MDIIEFLKGYSIYLLHYLILHVALLMRDTFSESIILLAATLITYALAVYLNKAMGHLYKLFNVSG